ncbi:MAG: hypothetical protein AB9921_00645 [Erysipelotrichaceae bacterium]
MNQETDNQEKSSFWTEASEDLSRNFRMYKRDTKALLKTLFIILLIQIIFEFGISGLFNGADYFLLFSIIITGVYPFAFLSYLFEVFIIYWLIGIFLSKFNIHYIVEWIMTTVLLVSIQSLLYTLVLASQISSYHTPFIMTKLFYYEMNRNYKDVFSILWTGFPSGNLNSVLYSISMLWPLLTLVVPFIGCIIQYLQNRKPITQLMVDRENQEKTDYLEKRRKEYKEKHKIERIEFKRERFYMKVLMFIGYAIIYIGLTLSFFIIPLFIIMFNQETDAFTFVFSIILSAMVLLFSYFGNSITQRFVEKLDIHYKASSSKIHWRLNFILFIFCLLLFVLSIFMDKPEQRTALISLRIGSGVYTLLLFINAIRLRKQWKYRFRKLSAQYNVSNMNFENHNTGVPEPLDSI